jgi:heme/copper-type cytochrome/quinol oxidase subunit 2
MKGTEMEIRFFWDWLSFFAGMGATVFLLVFLMVLVALGQASKARKKKSPTADEWLSSIADWQSKNK